MIQLLCKKCDKDLDVTMWNLGSDIKIKVHPCDCTPQCVMDNCDTMTTIKAELREQKKIYNDLLGDHNAMIDKVRALIT